MINILIFICYKELMIIILVRIIPKKTILHMIRLLIIFESLNIKIPKYSSIVIRNMMNDTKIKSIIQIIIFLLGNN